MLVIKSFEFGPEFTVELPADAKILAVNSFIGNNVYLSAMYDPKKPVIKRKFITINDAQEFMDLPMEHIGSFGLNMGAADGKVRIQMTHAFEILDKPAIVVPK